MTVKPGGEKERSPDGVRFRGSAEDVFDLTVMTAIGPLYTSRQRRRFLNERLCRPTAESW